VSFEHATKLAKLPQEQMRPGFEDEETERVTSTKSRPFQGTKTGTGKVGKKDEDVIEADPLEEIMREFFEEELKEKF